MRLRAEGLVFALALMAGWALANRLAPGPEVAPAAVTSAGARGAASMRAGDDAVRRGDFRQAARLYRKAWESSPQQRAQAAQSLRRLERRSGFTTPVNEKAVSATSSQLGDGFARQETAHFVILSDAGRQWTRERASLLERTYHQFFRVMDRLGHPAIPPQRKLLCVLFREHDAYQRFAQAHDNVEAAWVAGYYASLTNRIVFYDDATGPAAKQALEELEGYERDVTEARRGARAARRERNTEMALNLEAHAVDLSQRIELDRRRIREEAARSSEAKTIHEATHLLAFNCGVQSRSVQYPFWITEGLATTFETDRPRSAFGPDHATLKRQDDFEDAAADSGFISLPALVVKAKAPDASPAEADMMYTESYALVAYLYRYERRSLTAYLLSMLDQKPGEMEAAGRMERFRESFGDPAAVERRWLRRVRPSRRSGTLVGVQP